jgi:hypothetical protein
MRSLAELLDPSRNGEKLVGAWLREATNKVEVLPGDDSGRCLESLQVTTRSPMGAIAYSKAGVFIDARWIRVLGCGGQSFQRSLASWNRVGEAHRLEGAALVGDDVLGGFFALNGGRFDGELGSVFYFAPDTLRWEDMKSTYSDWLRWLFTGNLEEFYRGQRWPGWQEEVAALDGDSALLVYPFPSAQGPEFGQRHRGRVPVSELWGVYVEQLASL